MGWRLVFLLNVPIGLLVLLVAPAVLPDTPGEGSRGIDFPGLLSLAAAMVLLVVPLTFGPPLGWPLWTWLCLGGACAATAAFVSVELAAVRARRRPLLDIGAVVAPGVTPGLVVVLSTMAGFAGLLFCIPQYLQAGLGFTPLAAGLSFAPYPAGFAAAGLAWPRLGVRAQRWLPSAGLVGLAFAAAVLAARVGSGWSPGLLSLLFVAGVGHASAFSPLVARIAHGVGPGRAPAFSALVTTTMQIAIVMGVAVLGSLYLAEAGAHTHAASAHALALVCSVVAANSLVALLATWRVESRG